MCLSFRYQNALQTPGCWRGADSEAVPEWVRTGGLHVWPGGFVPGDYKKQARHLHLHVFPAYASQTRSSQGMGGALVRMGFSSDRESLRRGLLKAWCTGQGGGCGALPQPLRAALWLSSTLGCARFQDLADAFSPPRPKLILLGLLPSGLC